MPFTAGKDFTVVSGFTVGLDFLVSADGNPSGYLAGTLEGVAGSIQAAISIYGQVSGVLDGISGEFVGQNIANVGVISGGLDGIVGLIEAKYDVNVHRYVVSASCSDQDNAAGLSCGAAAPVDQSVFLSTKHCLPRQDATPLHRKTNSIFEQDIPIAVEICSVVDAASPMGDRIAARLDLLQLRCQRQCALTQQATSRFASLQAAFDLLHFVTSRSCHRVQDASQAIREEITVLAAYETLPGAAVYTAGTDFVVASDRGFTLGKTLAWPYIETIRYLRDTQSKGVTTREACSSWQLAQRVFKRQCHPIQDARRPPPGKSIIIDPPRPPPPDPPPGHQTFIIPTQSVYTMQHVISVVTLVGNVPVPMSSVSLSLNADAYAWQFSGTLLDPAALSLVEIVDNDPVTLKITIDGYVWHAIVEEIEHSREFGKQSITLKGRSPSALLGWPYVQPGSSAYGSDMTVQQLADMQMPIDWTLNWSQVTWVVPGNAWSYTNQTPIQVLAGIATDTGSMLVPARDSQSLAMMPRYPYWPWEFSGATPDLVIPEAAIKSVSLRPKLGTQANGVYVHGGDTGGVLGWCRLNGTAGDRLAATLSNNLMTDVVGCRALGSRILAGQYTQPLVKSFTTYLDGVIFPLAEIGQLVEVNLGATVERGIINGVGIEATLASVRQTIQIGEETPNVWALFKELLPRDPLLVGTLVSTDGATSIMTLIDSGVVSVRGTGTAGNKYYIRAGRIEGDAPSLTQQEIVV